MGPGELGMPNMRLRKALVFQGYHFSAPIYPFSWSSETLCTDLGVGVRAPRPSAICTWSLQRRSEAVK